jgi:hypothetical protein
MKKEISLVGIETEGMELTKLAEICKKKTAWKKMISDLEDGSTFYYHSGDNHIPDKIHGFVYSHS